MLTLHRYKELIREWCRRNGPVVILVIGSFLLGMYGMRLVYVLKERYQPTYCQRCVEDLRRE